VKNIGEIFGAALGKYCGIAWEALGRLLYNCDQGFGKCWGNFWERLLYNCDQGFGKCWGNF
jgi:hypothetical protein